MVARAKIGDTGAQPAPMQFEGDPQAHDVGHKMVKLGKAKHPHWRSGAKGNKQAKRMYANADTAHGHTKIKP